MRKNSRSGTESGKWIGKPPRVAPHVAVDAPLPDVGSATVWGRLIYALSTLWMHDPGRCRR
jgi:hypothetical protein